MFGVCNYIAVCVCIPCWVQWRLFVTFCWLHMVDLSDIVYAIKKRDPVLGRVFFRRMLDVNARSASGQTVLHVAAWCGRSDFVAFMCKNPHTDVDARDMHGTTALHGAALNLDLDIILCLMTAGADACALSTRRRTVLHFFALGVLTSGLSRRNRLGARVLRELLCVYTADIQAVSTFNDTARDVLVKANADDLVDCIDREVCTPGLSGYAFLP